MFLSQPPKLAFGVVAGHDFLDLYAFRKPRGFSSPRKFQGMEKIEFYSNKDAQYGFLSNFYRAPIALDGKVWPTTEHYFQAMKSFPDEENMEKVRCAKSPTEAASLGRRLPLMRKDWEEIKVGVMRTALRAKFEQHADLWARLVATKGKELVEHTKNDKYWADGGDGSGKNMLGKLLVELRDSGGKNSNV